MFQSVWRKRDGAQIYIDRTACYNCDHRDSCGDAAARAAECAGAGQKHHLHQQLEADHDDDGHVHRRQRQPGSQLGRQHHHERGEVAVDALCLYDPDDAGGLGVCGWNTGAGAVRLSLLQLPRSEKQHGDRRGALRGQRLPGQRDEVRGFLRFLSGGAVEECQVKKLQQNCLKIGWLECSGKAEKFVMANGGGSCIIDPRIIKEVVYPDREVEIDRDGKHYMRVLTGSGEKVRKLAVGRIRV